MKIHSTSRIFKSGNSMAVRIPKELGFADTAQEVEVVRLGNTLVVRLLEQETMADLGDILGMFSRDFMAQGRVFEFEPGHDCPFR